MSNGFVAKSVFLLAVSALALGSGSQAFAQDADDAASDETEDSNVILVTAQRRAQDIQDVPIAVTALTPKTLNVLAVKNTIDLVDSIPNLVGSNNTSLGSANVYFIRGSGQDESFPTFDPAVGTYIDEIFVARQNGNNVALFDVERTEVLRGPQGTLFGKNTTGGAINIVLSRPADEFGGFVEASYGRFDEVIVRGSVDLPASEDVRIKASAFYVDDNGWLPNPVLGRNINDRRGWGVRGALDIDITPDLNLYLTADYIDDDVTNVTGRDVIASDNNLTTGNFGEVDLQSISILQNGLDAIYPGVQSKADPGSVTKSLNFSSNLSYALDNGTISLILGYRQLENDFLNNFPLPNFDFLAVPGAEDDIFIIDNLGDFDQFSAELKYNAQLFDDVVNLTAGLFYLREDNVSDVAAYFGIFGATRDRVISNNTENLAAYAQADISITDQLIATLGGRFTDESKDFAVSDNAPVGDITDLTTANLIALGIPTTISESIFTPRFALQYFINDDINVFASATRGFRSGGWNARVNNASGLTPFLAERVWSYESGLRASFGPEFRMAITGFFQRTTNFQANTALQGGAFAVGNAGAQEVLGLEAEAFINPADNLNFYAALGLQDGKLFPSDAEFAACTPPNSQLSSFDINCDVARTRRTPAVQVTFGGSWDIDLGPVTVSPRGSIRMSSDLDIATRSLGPVDGYTLINAGVDITPSNNKAVTFSIECSNCTDERYLVSTFGQGDQYFNRPGRWAIRVRYNFGGHAF